MKGLEILFDHLALCCIADGDLHKPLSYYSQKLKPKQTIQLVHQQNKIRSVGDISIHPAASFLDSLDI